jgi:hypothetical protein
MWQTIHFYLCQLSVLVFSDFMIIVCQMFTHMWHTLPCCTLAIIDTAWEGMNGKLSKHSLTWCKPLYAVGIYRKEIAAYWKKFRKKSYSNRNHIRFDNTISLKCCKTSSACTIQLSTCMKCNIINHVVILHVFSLASIINFQSIDFCNHYIVQIFQTIFILMNYDRLENRRSWTRSLVW